MFHKININYNDIIQNEQILIEFLSKFSDNFSITVLIQKPYSQNPPIYKYCNKINPYYTQFIFEKKRLASRFFRTTETSNNDNLPLL